VCDEIAGSGGTAIAVELDVSDEAAVEHAVNTTLEELGSIDVLVNNAAVFSTLTMKPFHEISLAEWDDVMRVNLGGMFLCARAVSSPMRAQGSGRIINLSSSTVLTGRPNYLHYVTAKSGVIGFTRALARELGPAGVTVNTVMPGGTRTEVPRASMDDSHLAELIAGQAVHAPIDPDDIASAVAFLASAESRMITGQILVVDGGFAFS
jgi:3-oxoacyl-[acyl-carrier protein] reductase